MHRCVIAFRTLDAYLPSAPNAGKGFSGLGLRAYGLVRLIRSEEHTKWGTYQSTRVCFLRWVMKRRVNAYLRKIWVDNTCWRVFAFCTHSEVQNMRVSGFSGCTNVDAYFLTALSEENSRWRVLVCFILHCCIMHLCIVISSILHVCAWNV